MSSLHLDQAIRPHLLQNPVDVNRRDAECIGELTLSDGEVAGMAPPAVSISWTVMRTRPPARCTAPSRM